MKKLVCESEIYINPNQFKCCFVRRQRRGHLILTLIRSSATGSSATWRNENRENIIVAFRISQLDLAKEDYR